MLTFGVSLSPNSPCRVREALDSMHKLDRQYWCDRVKHPREVFSDHGEVSEEVLVVHGI